MLSELKVKSFQSLRDVTVPLAKYTVIVGPSSSGKSALTRALRTLCLGGRGTGFVSHGAKTSEVEVGWGEGENFTLISTARGKENRYDVSVVEDAVEVANETFTKLGGAVPEPVQQLLRVTELNFAGQFDKPFLLDAGGADVARTLGELTDVTRIFTAAREANRRRAGVSSTLNVRREDLAKTVLDVQQYLDLPARLTRQDELEAQWEAVADTVARAQRLTALLSEYDVSAGVLERAVVKEGALPSLDPVLAAQGKLSRFQTVVKEVIAARRAHTVAVGDVESAAAAEQELHRELHETFEAAGSCPTCGAVKEAWDLKAVGV